MKRFLRLDENTYISLQSITRVTFFEQSLRLDCNHPEFHGLTLYKGEDQTFEGQFQATLSEVEYLRVKAELERYVNSEFGDQ